MRVALIVGGAEPGRDGIGDHAALLVGELMRRGHDAWVLALNDPHVEQAGDRPIVQSGDTIPAIRLPSTLAPSQRFARAHQALDARGVDAVLYDFTATHYQPRGLVWPLAEEMSSLAQGRRRAVLFHEYALGSEGGAGLKRRLWGWAQRRGISRFLRRLDAPHLAATNHLYAAMLARDGWQAEVVPLYGNIPPRPAPPSNWCHARLAEAGIAPAGARGYYTAGFFGSLYDGAELAPVLPMLQQAARIADGRLAILSVGRLGAGETTWRRWQDHTDVPLLALGAREAHEIADYINGLDLGLASVSRSLAGKSGSLAAFTDFGLPTLMLNDSVIYACMPDRATDQPPNALLPDAGTAALLARQPVQPRVFRPVPALQATADWVERVLG